MFSFVRRLVLLQQQAEAAVLRKNVFDGAVEFHQTVAPLPQGAECSHCCLARSQIVVVALSAFAGKHWGAEQFHKKPFVGP